jgi:hypothetical protein
MIVYPHPLTSSYGLDAEFNPIGKSGRVLNPMMDKDGYGRLAVYLEDGAVKKMYVHRFILECVRGELLGDLEVNHIDGDIRNNHPDNLEAVTHKQNMKHAYAIGLKSNAGDHSPRRILTSELVEKIRASKESNKALAAKYGVSASTISDARLYKTWTSLL